MSDLRRIAQLFEWVVEDDDGDDPLVSVAVGGHHEPVLLSRALDVATCPKAGYGHDSWACPRCLILRDHASSVRRAVLAEPAKAWGRVDLLTLPPPQPPSVGELEGAPGVCLFHRGRRHNVYGEGESGKSWMGLITSCQEVSRGRAAVILNGEMEDEDIADWVRVCGASEQDVAEGLLVYPSAGLLDFDQRRTILRDVADSGRELSFVFGDSQTSMLSQAGLDPNKAEEIERLWAGLGKWFTGLPDHPAFVMTDHVSKGSDGSSPTGSIRKRNVVDTALFVENRQPFSPETPYGPARSGFSTVTITKGRRGGNGLSVARLVGHEGRVRLCSPALDLPWNAGKAPASSGAMANEALHILREVASVPDRPTQQVVDALGLGQTQGYKLLTGLAVDEAAAGPSALLVRRKVGREKVPMLTERGREVLRQADSSTSTPTRE